MRQIGHLPDEKQARLFGDYLFAKGIRNEVERETDTAWIIWVADEEQLDIARELLEKFQRDPAAPEYGHTAAGADRLRAREAKEEADYRKRFFARGQIFRSSRSYRAGVLTYFLILLCIIVAAYSRFGSDKDFLRPFFISDPEGGLTGFLPEVRAGEVWRLVTPMLIHFGPLHLVFNMMWLFSLGSMVEGVQGRWHFVLLTLGTAVVSNVAQYAYHGPGFGGMSGVVYGLFGYIWMRGKHDLRSGLHVDPQTVILMIVWFFVCMSGWMGPVANVAHGAGLVVGIVSGVMSAWYARNHPN